MVQTVLNLHKLIGEEKGTKRKAKTKPSERHGGAITESSITLQCTSPRLRTRWYYSALANTTLASEKESNFVLPRTICHISPSVQPFLKYRKIPKGQVPCVEIRYFLFAIPTIVGCLPRTHTKLLGYLISCLLFSLLSRKCQQTGTLSCSSKFANTTVSGTVRY